MRTRAALLVVGVAVVLGAVVGTSVLPQHGAAGDPVPTTSSASTTGATPRGPASSTRSALPGSPTPTGAATGPVTATNLLVTSDFRAVGLRVAPERSDVRLDVVVCDGLQTLDEIAQSGPGVQQRWQQGSISASEQAITDFDASYAAGTVKRIVRTLEGCQVDVATHWVYGPTHTERLGPDVTATWLGTVNGQLNTTGRAPSGERIDGGIAVLRHGAHIAVFSISWCGSAGDEPACVVAPGNAYEQLAALSRAAAKRLG